MKNIMMGISLFIFFSLILISSPSFGGCPCCTTKKTTTTTINGNVVVGSLSVDQIHQSSNDICSKGGEGFGGSTCYRRKDPDGDWDVIQKK